MLEMSGTSAASVWRQRGVELSSKVEKQIIDKNFILLKELKWPLQQQ